MEIVYQLLPTFIQIVAPALTVLVMALMWKLLAKVGIERDIATEQLITKYIKMGINYADGYARKQVTKPDGDEKLRVAIEFILEKFENSKLQAIAKDELKKLVEAQLARDSQG